MAVDEKLNTPLLDELEKGPWPSFVTEIKKARETSSMCDGLLGQLELSYKERIGHWKHGGIVGVLGYGGGVIGRYTDIPDQFPGNYCLPKEEFVEPDDQDAGIDDALCPWPWLNGAR